MPNHVSNWEDEENNRIVQLSVDYDHADNCVEIHNITPLSILFLCATTRTPQRQISIWTEKGRQMLRDLHAEKVGMDSLKQCVESGMLATA